MTCSPAQLDSNRRNAQKSTGPKTPEGKAASSANALKHGLTARQLLPEHEAAEVEARELAFCEELNPTGHVGFSLARHAARMSVRMERCGEHENAMLIEHVKQALAGFVPPEGATDAEVAKLRLEVERRALMDPSKEATLARKYELAAERGFFRALKELRLHEKAVRKADEEVLDARVEHVLGSISPAQGLSPEFEEMLREKSRESALMAAGLIDRVDFADLGGRADVPITVGRRR